MDRSALFVDAGYVLADGAMAVHGTRRRESVTWNYEGLLQLLSSLATERSGLPLLRCYWYEATVEGRRTADHDALADLPGVKLRLAKMRPGRREGVESEIHRDLTTLARNRAVSDAMVVSAEEDLTQVIADVQDLGMRVTLLHIAVDGNWTISRTLRQACDDVAEISSAHLRPYVELIPGAEPPHPDEQDGAPLITLRPQQVNGHMAPYMPAAASAENGHQAPPAIYTAPVVAEYQRSGPQLSRQYPEDPAASGEGSQLDERAPQPAGQPEGPAYPDSQEVRQGIPVVRPDLTASPADIPAVRQDIPQVREDQQLVWQAEQSSRPELPARRELPARPEFTPRQDLYAAPVAVPAAPEDRSMELPAARSRGTADLSGYSPGTARDLPPHDPVPGEPSVTDRAQPVPAATGSAQVRRLPTRGNPALPPPISPGAGYAPGPNGAYTGPQPVAPAGPVGQTPGAAGQSAGVPGLGAGQPAGLAPQPGALSGGPVNPGAPAAPGNLVNPMSPVNPANPMNSGNAAIPGSRAIPPGASGSPAGPAVYQPGQPTVSLAEAVQSAHEEGQEFGSSVARDAPALWLEAVLARKPRMPSDLEARLLQGSALPIDFLLHDEVRHALRRGFWDALERARR
ncbi:MAG TPA: NYN domain-containing protein [Trebonia sp.]